MSCTKTFKVFPHEFGNTRYTDTGTGNHAGEINPFHSAFRSAFQFSINQFHWTKQRIYPGEVFEGHCISLLTQKINNNKK